MHKMIAVVLILLAAVGFKTNMHVPKQPVYCDRKNIGFICNAIGEVLKVGNTGVYVIQCREKNTDLNVYNLPPEFRKDHLSVTFSGNMKLTSTLEDDWGELFEITAIR